jgi:hypothetical protein
MAAISDSCVCCAAKELRQGHRCDCLKVHETKREEEQQLLGSINKQKLIFFFKKPTTR